MSDGYTSIAEFIRKTRKDKGLTQIDVAARAGISVNSLRLYEAGKRNPKINHLKAILEAMGEHTNFTDHAEQLVARQNTTDKIITKIASLLRIDPVELEKHLGSELGADGNSHADDAISSSGGRLLAAFSQLNDEGQQKAVERVEELTEIPKYQKAPDATNAQD